MDSYEKNIAPPSPFSISLYIRNKDLTVVSMSKDKSRSKLLTEVQKEPSQYSEYVSQTQEEKKISNLDLEQEIDCPRCHDIMMLSSQFDRLCYLCEECDFHLNLN